MSWNRDGVPTQEDATQMDTNFTPQDIEDARLAGFQAARHLEGHLLCPHPKGSTLYRAWMDGWKLKLFEPVGSMRLPLDRRAA